MSKPPTSFKIYIGLVLLLAASNAAQVLLPSFQSVLPTAALPAPIPVIAPLSAGIGEEIIFRLFLVSLWVWLISAVILRGKWQNVIFWIMTIISALVFAMGHIPSVMILYNYTALSEISPVLWLEIILLNGVISVFAAFYMKKYGFLAAVGIHAYLYFIPRSKVEITVGMTDSSFSELVSRWYQLKPTTKSTKTR